MSLRWETRIGTTATSLNYPLIILLINSFRPAQRRKKKPSNRWNQLRGQVKIIIYRLTPDINGEYSVRSVIAPHTKFEKKSCTWIKKERKKFCINNAIKIAKIAAEGALCLLQQKPQPIQSVRAVHKLTHCAARALKVRCWNEMVFLEKELMHLDCYHEALQLATPPQDLLVYSVLCIESSQVALQAAAEWCSLVPRGQRGATAIWTRW